MNILNSALLLNLNTLTISAFINDKTDGQGPCWGMVKMKNLKRRAIFYLNFEKYIFPWHLANSLIFASHLTSWWLDLVNDFFRICNFQHGLFYLSTFLWCFIMTWNKVQLHSNSYRMNMLYNIILCLVKKSYGSLIVMLYYVLIICTSVTFFYWWSVILSVCVMMMSAWQIAMQFTCKQFILKKTICLLHKWI